MQRKKVIAYVSTKDLPMMQENDIKMLEFCMKYKVPIILNSDAHWEGDVGNHAFSEPLLQEMGFPGELTVNRSVEEYKKYINRFREK